MGPIHNLHEYGQSIWYDNIQRRLLTNGDFAEMISNGDIRGVTSNPAIFHKAISNSKDYDAALKPMAWSGWSAEEIFYQLAIEDIQAAADLFLPLYEQSNRGDGYVSLEVSPLLARDAAGTSREAKLLWERVNRPNLMIKIPATIQGLEAIKETVSFGINVNVTLIFSLERYEQVIKAYMEGLEERAAAGLPIGSIASVASFFVSRVDSKVDQRLVALNQPEDTDCLMGKAALSNARLAYALFKKHFYSDRFSQLEKKAARPQRPLWASTGTKNPEYSDVLYIDELIAPFSVNTVPPATLDAFRDHGEPSLSLEGKEEESQKVFDDLGNLGISMRKITDSLEEEGVQAFADAYHMLLDTLDQRLKEAQAELGPLQTAVQMRVNQLAESDTVNRIFLHDPTIWTNNPEDRLEISNRLGWLKAPEEGMGLISDLNRFAEKCQEDGFTHALLLGMGGSSLAPEVMRNILGVGSINEHDALDLSILDSTHPEQVKTAFDRSAIEQTLYIVSSKSGSTSEVLAFLDYFWGKAKLALGEKAAQHFVAITDPGSKLVMIARERNFRHVFLADPNVGGRYSALTAFGLVPSALMGHNVGKLLKRAQQMSNECSPDIPTGRNPGLVLGALIGEAATQGYDKLRIISDPELIAFGSWMEQLIAESSGKQGKGIIPVDGELVGMPPENEKDRLFVYLSHNGKSASLLEQLQSAGHPVVELSIPDLNDLGAEFYRWEIATAVACSILGVNAFNQPDVQDNKTRTSNKIDTFLKHKSLDEKNPAWENNKGQIFGSSFNEYEGLEELSAVVKMFLDQVKPGDYVAINAYLPRDPQTIKSLNKLRGFIQKYTGKATTLGFGPRFLHSTGQLHKGGPNNGFYLQLTAEIMDDLLISEQGLTFGTMLRAQALGDMEALQARERRVIRVHLTKGVIEDLF
jgi:transaldolase / glucose-6-phosphate isomerase